jgi:hypothetical protein
MTKTKKPEPTKPKWCNAPTRDWITDRAVEPAGAWATIVTYTGQHVSGKVTCWIGPGECELDTGARGVLLETHQRRAAKAPQS